MIFPEKLYKGDKIAIISPASIVKKDYVLRSAKRIEHLGFTPVIMPSAIDNGVGSYASSKANRLMDFMEAYTNPEIKAILCARGGYGVVHLIDDIPLDLLRNNPKWIIGYSDISAFHAMMQRAGVASIHSLMAKHLSEEPDDDASVKALIEILTSGLPIEYSVASHPFNLQGKAEGTLKGGNFAVLSGLNATKYDMFEISKNEKVILFLEDISEAIYSIERMLYNLNLRGVLKKVKGLIFGQFTEYKSDLNHSSMEEMISKRLSDFGIKEIPVAFNFPVGHVRNNLPLVEGCRAELIVTSGAVTLSQNK